ncbi:SIS domain-containing protein [Egicoccus sp. AB-alg6-2]|uniref:SIS domain-containing protein n=1 Tax=Egicoccus sp. AB-alg6-2 TaxID=3242692 RepID=UPI00359DBD8C
MTPHEEILQQPEVLRRLFATQHPTAAAVARQWRDAAPTHVVIAARGTSDNAARYAQYLWGQRARLTVGLAAPALFAEGTPSPRLDGAVVVGISQSGASPDLVAVLAEARRQGRPTLAITNEPASPLAEVADQVLALGAGPERAVAATKTYTAQLGAVALIAAALAPADDGDDLGRVPDAVASALADEAVVAEVAARWADFDRCAVLGRATGLATAHEWALKLQELAYVLAQPASPADFAHGPRAVVEPDFPVLAVATDGRWLAGMLDTLAGLRQQGARTLVLADRPEHVRHVADDVLAVPGGVAEWLSPIVAIVAAQLWCLHVTVARGGDPESPRGLTKVTRTR